MGFSKISRRVFLGAGIAAVATATVRAFAALIEPFRPSHAHDQPWLPSLPLSFKSPRLKRFVDPLPIPPQRQIGGTILMAESLHRFHRDLDEVPSWGFDGESHLGPTLIAQRGERTPTTFVNALGAHVMARDVDSELHGASEHDRTMPRTSVHLHGAPNSPESDGHPMATFVPGQQLTYEFNNDMEAATLWYHDHSMAITRLNVYAGLAGQYWIRDEWDTGQPDNPLGLPAGDYEIPLTISDKLFFPDGSMRYQGTPTVAADHWAGGLCGDVMVVNGKAWPYLEVDRGIYRFRVLNATQLNDYRLTFSNDMPFWVIGSDGGLLDAPALVAELDVANGERYDLLVDFSHLKPGTRVELRNIMPISWAGKLIGAHAVPRVMRFIVRAAQGDYQQIPQRLRGGSGLPPTLPAVGTPSAVRVMTMVTTLDFSTIRWISTGVMTMNNLRWTDPGYPEPLQGAIEQWDIVNSDVLGQVHVMHVHLAQFRIIGRFDLDLKRYIQDHPVPTVGTPWAPPVDDYLVGAMQPAAPYELGWKDTVRCPPLQVTRFIVRWPTAAELGFDPDADFVAPDGTVERGYVWHCHVLDHEDHEMMQRLRLRDGSGMPGDWIPPDGEMPMDSSHSG